MRVSPCVRNSLNMDWVYKVRASDSSGFENRLSAYDGEGGRIHVGTRAKLFFLEVATAVWK